MHRTREDTTIAVVVTTISDGRFLDRYVEAIERDPFPQAITLYVVGDSNTPPSCAARAADVAARGIRCRFYDVEQQLAFLEPFPELAANIPLRSDNRRNIGYLLAFHDHNDVIVSVDDDNLPLPDSPFFAGHELVGTTQTLPIVASRSGWFNLCALLDIRDRHGRDVIAYPRGFPYARRIDNDSVALDRRETGVVGINIGLWLGDPDIDAATRLVTGCSARPAGGGVYLLGPGQRTPINSQNTAIAWHAVPAYYFALMGHIVGGMPMDRFGDILSGYFVQLCAEAVGHRVRVGTPLVIQERNQHNLFKDLWHELPCIALIEELLPLIERPLSPAVGYDEAYLELAERLEEWAHGPRKFLWSEDLTPYCEKLAALMRTWVAACRQIAGPAALRCHSDGA